MSYRLLRPQTTIRSGGRDDRSVTVTCSTESVGRDDIVLVSNGIELDNYRRNPIFLWQHDPGAPVARAEYIAVENGDLVARVRFPEAGVSAKADEVLGLIRAGIVNGASTGFDVIDAEPLNPARPRDGIRILRCELQEVSFCSIPALPDALITERAMRNRSSITPAQKRTAERYAADLRASAPRWLAPHHRLARKYAVELASAAPTKPLRNRYQRTAEKFEAELRAAKPSGLSVTSHLKTARRFEAELRGFR